MEIKETMCVNRFIDTLAFYESNHKAFNCTDCHSSDYETFPHSGNLRMEMMFACIDCHGGDEEYAKFHFEIFLITAKVQIQIKQQARITI